MTAFAQLQARIAARLAVLSCGVSVLGIGTSSLIGYAVGFTGLYQWSNAAIGMAPNTAVGFALSGMALAVLGASNRVWRCN